MIACEMPAKARTLFIYLLPVTNDSEQYVEDLLAQVAGRFFRAFSLLERRDTLKKKSKSRAAMSVMISIIQKRAPTQRTVTKSISWARQKGVRMYKVQPIQRAKKIGMLMYAVRKSCVFHTKKT
jgi:hypothetical protein